MLLVGSHLDPDIEKYLNGKNNKDFPGIKKNSGAEIRKFYGKPILKITQKYDPDMFNLFEKILINPHWLILLSSSSNIDKHEMIIECNILQGELINPGITFAKNDVHIYNDGGEEEIYRLPLYYPARNVCISTKRNCYIFQVILAEEYPSDKLSLIKYIEETPFEVKTMIENITNLTV